MCGRWPWRIIANLQKHDETRLPPPESDEATVRPVFGHVFGVMAVPGRTGWTLRPDRSCPERYGGEVAVSSAKKADVQRPLGHGDPVRALRHHLRRDLDLRQATVAADSAAAAAIGPTPS